VPERSATVFEAPAVVAGLDDIAVVGQPIEQRRRHLGVAKYARPFAEGEIGGDDDRGALHLRQDALRPRHARPVPEHFLAGLDYQDKLARFLENHDEPRAAATFPLASTKPPRSSRYCRPACAFSTRGNSRSGESESRLTSAAARMSRSIRRWASSTTVSSRRCVSRLSATGNGRSRMHAGLGRQLDA